MARKPRHASLLKSLILVGACTQIITQIELRINNYLVNYLANVWQAIQSLSPTAK